MSKFLLAALFANARRVDVSKFRVENTATLRLITSDLRVKEVKVQIEDLGNKLDDLENRSRRNNLRFEGIPESPNET